MSGNPFPASDNPYQAPSFSSASSDVVGSDLDLDRSARMLSQTKPWVRFISVMMFIGSAFMVLGGIAMMIGGAAGLGGAGAFLGIVYIVMALLYIVPAVFLWSYADRIGRFLQQKSPGTLASALESQKSFWKFMGILMLIVLCIYAMIFVFAIVGVGMMGMR